MSEWFIVTLDDEEDVLDIYVDLLDSPDYSVRAFSRPEEMLAFYKEHYNKILIVLCDYEMGTHNGIEVRKECALTSPEVPFVIITGFWDRNLAIRAMEHGVKAFVDKPIKAETLEENLQKYAYPRLERLKEDLEMVQGFIDESQDMLREIEELILDLEERPGDTDVLATYFRLLHTIKGTANCVELTNLGQFAHKYEDFIGELREGKRAFDGSTINTLLAGIDTLSEYYEYVTEYGHDKSSDLTEKVSIFNQRKSSTPAVVANDSSSNDEGDSQDHKNKSESKKNEKIQVELKILDEFMEESGELTVIRNSIAKLVGGLATEYRGDENFDNLQELLGGLYQVTTEIQSKIVEMRKVPVGRVLKPFKRLVRDLGNQLHKKVGLRIVGEDLYVDNIIAKLLSNTLVHMIRNSLDHGVESPEERVKSKKTAEGNIGIEVHDSGDKLVVKLIDDGRGIDINKIKNKAIEKGLYVPDDFHHMADSEIYGIIFESGFSTAEQVSDVSGRGVGMDMVRSSIEDAGGELVVDSVLGKGTTIQLIIPRPKSVLIVNTLQVLVSDYSFLISMEDVVELVHLSQENKRSRIEVVNEVPLLIHDSETLPLLQLKSIFKENSQGFGDEIQRVVICRVNKQQVAIVVDEILDFEEVVNRPLHSYVENSELFQGSALMGTGEVSLILSLEGIIEHFNIQTEKRSNRKGRVSFENSSDEESNRFMVFQGFNNDSFAIHLDSIVRLEAFSRDQIFRTGNLAVVTYWGQNLQLIEPFKPNDSFGICSRKDTVQVVVVRCQKRSYGIVVDRIFDVVSGVYCRNQSSSTTLKLDSQLFPEMIDTGDRFLLALDTEQLQNQSISGPVLERRVS